MWLTAVFISKYSLLMELFIGSGLFYVSIFPDMMMEVGIPERF